MARSKAPTLAYSGSKFKPGWMAKWLAAPYRIRPAGYLPYRYVVSAADGDQVDKSLLPEHPSLIDVEAEAVAAYLESLKKELNASEPAQVVTEVRAQVHFEKILGCSACHQSRPGLGGLSAPELYTAAERLDRRWATAFISDPTYWRPGLMPKPSMRKEQMGAIVEYLFQTAERQGQTRPLAAKVEGARALASTDGAPPSNDRARTLYLVYCSQCHGVQGNGKGINAPFMFVSPRNHTSREEMGMLTDERLYAAIKLGGNAVGRSAMMPAWGAVIKDSDIQLLVEYLRSLSGGGTVGGR
jgi:mono/diheme cytochrome c family protein